MIAEGTLRKTIELPGCNVRRELPVPSVRVKLGEPLAKRSQFLRRKLSDFAFDLLHPVHEVPHFPEYTSASHVMPARRFRAHTISQRAAAASTGDDQTPGMGRRNAIEPPKCPSAFRHMNPP